MFLIGSFSEYSRSLLVLERFGGAEKRFRDVSIPAVGCGGRDGGPQGASPLQQGHAQGKSLLPCVITEDTKSFIC